MESQRPANPGVLRLRLCDSSLREPVRQLAVPLFGAAPSGVVLVTACVQCPSATWRSCSCATALLLTIDAQTTWIG